MKKPIARKNDIVVQQAKDETLIFDLKTNRAYCLNETSAFVWRQCNGSKTVAEITDTLSVHFKTLISVEFVLLALDQLYRDDLLEDGFGEHFKGGLRRELIRKIGFASLVALPAISSLVAPSAIMAQSGGGGGALLSTCVPGPNACDPGFICTPTSHSTDTGATGGTPTGIDQCCQPFSSRLDQTSIFCAGPPCNTAPGGFGCCSNSASSTAPIPGCSFNSCVCN